MRNGRGGTGVGPSDRYENAFFATKLYFSDILVMTLFAIYWRVRSQLYRSRLLRVNLHSAAFLSNTHLVPPSLEQYSILLTFDRAN